MSEDDNKVVTGPWTEEALRLAQRRARFERPVSGAGHDALESPEAFAKYIEDTSKLPAHQVPTRYSTLGIIVYSAFYTAEGRRQDTAARSEQCKAISKTLKASSATILKVIETHPLDSCAIELVNLAILPRQGQKPLVTFQASEIAAGLEHNLHRQGDEAATYFARMHQITQQQPECLQGLSSVLSTGLRHGHFDNADFCGLLGAAFQQDTVMPDDCERLLESALAWKEETAKNGQFSDFCQKILTPAMQRNPSLVGMVADVVAPAEGEAARIDEEGRLRLAAALSKAISKPARAADRHGVSIKPPIAAND